MLVVGNVDGRTAADTPRGVDRTLYQWPHGLSKPLKHVRKRRFRKRLMRVRAAVCACVHGEASLRAPSSLEVAHAHACLVVADDRGR